jgi:hypothetical protein
LLIGGGDRSLGETGQRGVSFSSEVMDSFRGTGARMELESEVDGCSLGVAAAESTLCCAAAEGGLLRLLGRDGLTSLALFFLDLPPDVRGTFDLSEGLTGDDSLEGSGEFAADEVRFACSLFVDGTEDVESRRADEEVEGSRLDLGTAVTGVILSESAGSVVSWTVPVMEEKGLSSMVALALGFWV